MANKQLFASIRGKLFPRTDACNNEGAPAYAREARHQLAQLAMTGTLHPTFYADAEAQLADVMALADKVPPRFLAQAAVWARKRGNMKDMPALLLAALSARAPLLLARAFPKVVDNGRMLRTFVEIMRSGAAGRKSLGSRPKALVAGWLNGASDAAILAASVGNRPSLADVLKMVHPKPASAARAALFAWVLKKPYDVALVPEAVRALELFRRDPEAAVPQVPFQLLTSLGLTPLHWAAIARSAGWQMLRMNLNTFDRQCVFAVDGMPELIAERLRNRDEIQRSRVLPYQLLAAYLAASDDVPGIVREALQDALEIATANVPALAGNVVVCPDVSGSMQSPVTGRRKGATSKVSCIDVAALMAACIVRHNPSARVLPFERDVVDVKVNPRDSVMTNALRLGAIGGGGTACSAPLAKLNREKAKVDIVLIVSDNESWADMRRGCVGDGQGTSATGLMYEWRQLKARNPRARLVLIDLQPYGTTQAPEADDVLNVGGFSDAVFELVAAFAKGELSPAHWVGEIERIEL